MGNLFSGEPAADPDQILRTHMAEMERLEREYNDQRKRDNAAFKQMFDDLKNSTAEDRERYQQNFLNQQAKFDDERAAERKRHEEQITSLVQYAEEAKMREKELEEQLQEPIKEREQKVAFVNGLKLKIRQKDSLLLAGWKGTGKSTFLWLLNKGPKPVQTTSDGTPEIVHLDGYMDTIGLAGWSPEEMLKMLVLLIYEGIPRDIIIFSNDRIALPLASLAAIGITNLMVVIMSSAFWFCHDNNLITLVMDKGLRKLQSKGDLELAYNVKVYEDIRKFCLGTPVTHHEDLNALVRARQNAGIRPLQRLTQQLGQYFTVATENTFGPMEALFRFIYIYEKKYNKDQLSFMNNAKLQEF